MARLRAYTDRGIALRSYLTALLLVPLLTCVGFAGWVVTSRVSDAGDAQHAAELVRTAGRLSVAQRAVQSELMPDVLQEVLANPVLRGLAELYDTSEKAVGVSDVQVARLRSASDAAVRELGRDHSGAALARRTATGLASARKAIDSGIGLSTGYATLLRIVARLSDAARAAVAAAAGLGLGTTVGAALNDVRLTDDAGRFGVLELLQLDGVEFTGLTRDPNVRQTFTESWAAFQAASSRVLGEASPRVADRWRAALATPAARAFDAAATAVALDPRARVSTQRVVALQRLHAARAARLAAIEKSAVDRAVDAASAQQSAATRYAVLIALLVALAIAVSALIVWVVLRAITRPLHILARDAAMVSKGELVDVAVGGPNEVRTVAAGLGAAVDSLRQVEAQAAAVARGDLESDIVRRSLLGPLGEVMHRSITTIIDAINARDLAQSDLAYRATHDALTGLPNRTQALLSTTHALQQARRSGAGTCLMFVDLDRFKAVNDTFGHAAGDIVLQVTAQRMSEAVRDADSVFRLGGDEFVVLLEDTDPDFAFVTLAERIIEVVSEPVAVAEGVARIGASIGISVSQDASVDAEQLLNESDAAAYSVKRSGRGKVGIYDDALRASLLERAELECALEQAIELDELLLHFQPVVELDGGRVAGFEALIRWERPGHGLCYPDSFVPVAEKSSLINRIDRWAMRAATQQLSRWDREGTHPPGLTMAVNVSGRHLASSELVTDVRDALADAGLDPRRLVVEVTETVLVDDARSLANMQALRSLGVVVAIDDFGTGYTSIGQLSNLPIDVIKIDRSFTGSTDLARQKLVRLIVETAHAFQLSVVGEGIELATQRDALADVHADLAQGYLFGRPAPAGSPAQATPLPADHGAAGGVRLHE